MQETENPRAVRRRRKRRRRRLLAGLLLMLMLAGFGYVIYAYTDLLQSQETAQQIEPQEPATAVTRRGDLVLTASGVGTLLAAEERALGFRTGGTVKTVNVAVGNRVKAGDLLAALDDGDVRLEVAQHGIDLRKTELALNAVTDDASVAEITAAQAALASAQAEYDALIEPPSEDELSAARNDLASAQQTLNTLVSELTSDETTVLVADLRSAEVALQQAQWDYDQAERQGDATAEAAALEDAIIAHEKALAQYNLEAAGAKSEEISAARARVAEAQSALNALEDGPGEMAIAAAEAKRIQAQAQLDEIIDGPDPDALESATLSVQQAQHNLDAALLDLEGSMIRAPINGVVTAVNAQVGEQAGTEPVVRVTELASAQVRFWLEEVDVAAAAVGNPVNIIFEAFPEHTFSGEIVRVEPGLVDVEGAAAIQAWAEIDVAEHPLTLLFGMNAEIEVIAGEAKDAMLAPVQALRELVPGSYAVFVVSPAGELEMRPVDVGIRDFVNVEIISGLDAGETVSTGDVDTQ